MGKLSSLDVYRWRKAHRAPAPPPAPQTDARVAAARAGLPARLGEAAAPTCTICGKPIVVPDTADPIEARALRRVLRAEGLCASCYAPF